MSSRAALARRATLRSAALLEPYTHSLRAVEALLPSSPVITPPTPSQEFVEAAVFASLGYWHSPGGESLTYHGSIEITRLVAARESLTVYVLPNGTLHETLAMRLLPSWDLGDGLVANGVPGLRYRVLPERSGLEFFILNMRGSVRFVGVSVQGFLEERNELLREARYRSFGSPEVLSPEEAASTEEKRYAHPEIVSAVLRRFGLLRAFGIRGVDTWWNRVGRFSVELQVEGIDLLKLDRLLAGLQSPVFSPRLVLEGTDAYPYHTCLRFDGGDSELHLRIFEVGTRS